MTVSADRPLVSVVVPTLNRAGFLRETIDSILAQDYPHIECFVRDGGSTDGTVEILRSYGSLIRWTSERDGGPFVAINRGWQGSSGSILAWLNADDCWRPGAVSLAVDFLGRHPEVDVAYGRCGVVDVAGREQWVLPAKPWTLERALIYCDHVIDQPASFIRRSAAERVGWLDNGWLHDQEFWLRLGLAGGVFAAIDHHLADGRVHAGNVGSDARRILPLKVELIERAFDRWSIPPEFRHRRRRAVSNAHVRGFDSLQPGRAADWPLGLATLVRAVRADPSNVPFIVGRLVQLFGIFARRGLRDPRLNG